ncbi:MAG TPA: helix-turn-helix transcriptional regulator [Actinomyces sp.]|nr:helix-turn-helix transcriptional regulator [Acidobacteriota bacterium]HHT41758.1 helix-turn-helix transcriptional regulator [Actinomyces sp.]
MSSKRASARRPSKKQALNQKSSKNEPQHRIEVTLDAVLEKREMTLTALSEETGITMANLSILKTGKARAVRFSTLTAICEALDCQPADILRLN